MNIWTKILLFFPIWLFFLVIFYGIVFLVYPESFSGSKIEFDTLISTDYGLYILIEKYTTFSLKSIPLINSNPLLWQRSSNTKQDDKYGYETRDYEALFTRGRQRAKNCA